MARTSRRDASENIGEVLAMMRHSFSTSDSVRYLLALVVLRWLADAKRQNYPLPFPLQLPPDLEYHIPLMQPPDLPDWLERMLRELEQRNQQELGGVFQHLHFRSPRFTFSQPDRGILGRAIDLLWMKDRHGCSWALLVASLDAARRAMVINSGAPEMNTPDSICALATGLVRPSAWDLVYDPACGTGTMLLQCKEFVETEPPSAWTLAGAERNPAAWMVAKLSVLSQGFSSRGIRRADVLRPAAVAGDAALEGKYDVVLSHFPWSRKEWRSEDTPTEAHPVFRAGLPPKNNADYAYILHMVSAMKPGSGRMTAVVSTGALSRTGNEGRIRARLVMDNLIDSVIALPDKLFQFTPAAAALLVIRRDRRPGQRILFIDARGMAVQSKSANTLPPDRVQGILQLYSRCAQQEGVAALVDPRDVAANGYSLSVALYVQQPVEGEPHDLVEVRARRKELRDQLRKLNDRIDALLASHAHPAEEPEREAVTE